MHIEEIRPKVRTFTLTVTTEELAVIREGVFLFYSDPSELTYYGRPHQTAEAAKRNAENIYTEISKAWTQ